MARQFDLYRLADGGQVLVIQSDLLEDLNTRVVCLALPDIASPQGFAGLSPRLTAGDLGIHIAPHVVATLTLAELGTHVASFSHERERIIRAVDVMLTGS